MIDLPYVRIAKVLRYIAYDAVDATKYLRYGNVLRRVGRRRHAFVADLGDILFLSILRWSRYMESLDDCSGLVEMCQFRGRSQFGPKNVYVSRVLCVYVFVNDTEKIRYNFFFIQPNLLIVL